MQECVCRYAAFVIMFYASNFRAQIADFTESHHLWSHATTIIWGQELYDPNVI